MAIDGLDDDAIRAILAGARRVAVVGASPRPERPSHQAVLFFRDRGLDVVPVNPGVAGGTIAGLTVAADLAGAAPLDLVDIFRASDHVGPIVDDAIALGARAIWMQLGVIDETAAARARAAGLAVVMNRCPMIEWPRLHLGRRLVS
jgi:predicted CoA-binding protein